VNGQQPADAVEGCADVVKKGDRGRSLRGGATPSGVLRARRICRSL
jgi:hypothetical protein